jgi:dTDP-4-dehydrorhamnose reductase
MTAIIPTTRILLVGATGLLGQALDREAQARGHAVLGAARKGAAYTVDLVDAAATGALIEKTAPDLVINAAAMTDLDQCERELDAAHRVNAEAVGVMAQACARPGISLVQVSADHFFTGDRDRLHDETAPVHLVNEYARSKFAGEALAMTAPKALVVRTNVTGLRGWPRPTFFEWAVDALRHRKPMVLFGDYFTSTIDADSLARAILDLVDRKATGLINVAAREVASKRQFMEALALAMGIKLDWAVEGSVRSLSVHRAESLGLDVSRAESVLGYQLPDLRTVITRLVASMEMAHAV